MGLHPRGEGAVAGAIADGVTIGAAGIADDARRPVPTEGDTIQILRAGEAVAIEEAVARIAGGHEAAALLPSRRRARRVVPATGVIGDPAPTTAAQDDARVMGPTRLLALVALAAVRAALGVARAGVSDIDAAEGVAPDLRLVLVALPRYGGHRAVLLHQTEDGEAHQQGAPGGACHEGTREAIEVGSVHGAGLSTQEEWTPSTLEGGPVDVKPRRPRPCPPARSRRGRVERNDRESRRATDTLHLSARCHRLRDGGTVASSS